MRFFKVGLVALASSAALLAAAPAAAQTTTSFAHLSGLNYDLIDMNLEDGITAAITFAKPSTYFQGYITDSTGTNLAQLGEGNILTASTASSAVSASIIGDNMVDATFSAGGATNNNEKYASLVRLAVSFTLTANTQVLFFANSSLGSSFDKSTDATATAGTYFDIVQTLPTSSVSSHIIDMNGTLDKELQAEFINASSASAQRILVAAAFAQGAGPSVSPVPEPETYAMLLAGLGLVGAAARRRKVKAATC